MSRWCKAVLEEYPWINIVGECWTSTADHLAYWQGGNPNKDGFDSHLPSIMDFPLQEATIAALCEEGNAHMWGRGLTRAYEAISHDFTAKLFQWRKNTPVLHTGKTMHFLTRDNTYAFFRYDGSATVFVYVNNSSEPRTIPWDNYAEISGGLSEGTNVLTGVKVDASAYTAPAQSVLILEF